MTTAGEGRGIAVVGDTAEDMQLGGEWSPTIAQLEIAPEPQGDRFKFIKLCML
jgi:hypothetical protein